MCVCESFSPTASILLSMVQQLSTCISSSPDDHLDYFVSSMRCDRDLLILPKVFYGTGKYYCQTNKSAGEIVGWRDIIITQ